MLVFVISWLVIPLSGTPGHLFCHFLLFIISFVDLIFSQVFPSLQRAKGDVIAEQECLYAKTKAQTHFRSTLPANEREDTERHWSIMSEISDRICGKQAWELLRNVISSIYIIYRAEENTIEITYVISGSLIELRILNRITCSYGTVIVLQGWKELINPDDQKGWQAQSSREAKDTHGEFHFEIPFYSTLQSSRSWKHSCRSAQSDYVECYANFKEIVIIITRIL